MIDNSQHDSNDRGDKDGGDSNSFHRGSFVFMEIYDRCIGVHPIRELGSHPSISQGEIIQKLLFHHLMYFT